MIRQATTRDIDALTRLGIEALSIDGYEELALSPIKVKSVVREAVSSAPHFAWVSERHGEVVGGLVAISVPMMLYERNEGTVMMWYCPVAGDGVRLMNEFIGWVKSRPIIKLVNYMGERKGDPRIIRLLKKRYGFIDDVPYLYRM